MPQVRLPRAAGVALLVATLANLAYACLVPLGGSANQILDAAAARPAVATTAAVLDTVFRIGVSIGALALAQLARRRAGLATAGAWSVVVGSICLTIVTAVVLLYAESAVADPDVVVELVAGLQANPGYLALLATGFAALTVGVTLLLVALSGDGRRLRGVIVLFILGSVVGLALADQRLAQVAGALLTGTALARLALLLLRPMDADMDATGDSQLAPRASSV